MAKRHTVSSTTPAFIHASYSFASYQRYSDLPARRAIFAASHTAGDFGGSCDGSWVAAGRRSRNGGYCSTTASGTEGRPSCFMGAVRREGNPRATRVVSPGNGGSTSSLGLASNKRRRSDNNNGKHPADVVALQKDYLRRVKAAGLRRAWREVPTILAEMSAQGVPRNLFVYNTAISALARCRRPLQAEALLAAMLDDQVAPDKISYNSAINAHARCGDLDSARALLERMRSLGPLLRPDVITFNTLADAAAKRGNAAAGAEVLAMMAEEGVAPDVITYNACIAACKPKGDLRRAVALLELMKDDGVVPDQRSYSAVIAAAGRRGESVRVLDILDDMRREGLSPDRVTFGTAIAAVGANGEWETATSLLAEMKEAGISPDAMSYTGALGACGRAGEWEVALRLLKEMRQDGLPPNAFSYSAAMDACGKAGRQGEALGLLAEMRRVNVRADTVAYNSAIDACSVNGDWSAALKLLQEMKDGSGSTGGGNSGGAAAPKPDVVSYGGAITACARGGRADEALNLVAELRANEAKAAAAAVRGKGGRAAGGEGGAAGLVLPNLVTYSAALFACLKAGEVWRGAELLNEMIAAGIKPNSIHCDTMVAAWSAAGEPERALSLMKRLQAQGFEPSLGTYEALVWGFAQVADWETAVRLLAYTLGHGLHPGARSWDAAIAACSQAGHWERALALLADMRRQGVRPSRITYTAAVAGLNRPRYADWGPKLEKLARLLRDRAKSEDDDGDNASASSGGAVPGEESDEGGGDDGKRPGVSRRGVAGSNLSPEDFDEPIEALGDAGDADGAACLLRVMRQEGFHASPRAYRSVIYACARVGHLTEAITLAKEMESSRSEVALRSEALFDVEDHASVRTKGVRGDEAKGADHSRGGGAAVEVEADILTPSVVAMADGGLDTAAEGREFDLAVVYNCIVCNFARAATQKAGGAGGDGNAGRSWSSVCDQRRGRGDVSAASPRDGQRRGVGRDAKEEGEDGDDGAGLVALLLDAAESEDGEATYGGVEIATAKGLASSPVAIAGDGVAVGQATGRRRGEDSDSLNGLES